LKAQQDLVRKILEHWRTGYAPTFNPARKEALDLVEIAADFDDCLAKVTDCAGRPPKVVVTGAALTGDLTSFGELRQAMEKNAEPYCVVWNGQRLAQGHLHGACQTFAACRETIQPPAGPLRRGDGAGPVDTEL
jgi:hypothetical protein